ncbi:MAG TPA: fused MFS/spermidine synthase [Egibacteraceae bacterium]|nr:fused MFS/spermidine synthase [Egibacteraceae bacterium]
MPAFAAGLVVFATSAAVLVLEILAARLLAPYVGVTLQTYTGIIGTVLAGIAVGSWYGGRLADRVDPRRLLGPMVLIGGVLALAAVPAVTFFGSALAGGGGPLVIIILSLAGFFAPAAVLSAVTPTVVKLQLASLDETGEVVGRLSALGTAGAIFGTFATGFLLVAAWPSRPIVVGLGGLLVLGGLGLWWWLAPQREQFPAPLVMLAVVAGGLALLLPSPCDFESAYFCARVDAAEDRDSGRVLVLDRLRHSYVDLDDPRHLGFGYTQVFADVIDASTAPREPVAALHIGGGGFSMPRYLAAERPGSDSLVLELDPMLVAVARNELGLQTGPDLRVETGDARLGVAAQPAARWDVVIGDAFGGLAVPWHLTTAEFVHDVRATLRPGGVYMINVIDFPPSRFARAEAATLAAVFDHVALVAPLRRILGAEGGNFVLVGSDAPIDAEAIRREIDARGGDEEVVTGSRYEEFVGSARVLTDDHAPVDQLLTPHPQ